MEKRKYDSTVARIAGNILSGCSVWTSGYADVERAVKLARLVVEETQRTEAAPALDASLPPADPDSARAAYMRRIDPDR